MDSRIRRLLWFGISTAIIAAVIYFANPARFITAAKSADTVLLLPAFFFGMANFLIWSYVWHSFFDQMDIPVPYLRSLRIFLAGHFLNSITPLGQFGGEPFMAYIISKNTEADYEKAISTVFSADIINAVPGFTFILGGSVYLLLFSSINEVILETLYIVLVATLVGGIFVYLLWFESGKIEGFLIGLMHRTTNLLGRGKTWAEKMEGRLRKVEESFRTVGSSPRHLFKVAAVAHVGFLSQLACLWFVLFSLGVGTEFAPLYFVLVLSSFANYAPTPGGSGAYEAGMAALLVFFVPIEFATAVVAAIIFRATTYWTGMVTGYLSFNTLENGG